MKFKYLFITLLLILPILRIISNYQYKQTVNVETLIFNIPILDNFSSPDSITLTIKLNLPKYYTLKKHVINYSDCTSCGDQSYSFYKNPSKETIAEKDTITLGFFKIFDTNRDFDSTVFSIISYRNASTDDLLLNNSSNKSMIESYIKQLRSELPSNTKINTIKTNLNGSEILSVEYSIKNKFYSSNATETKLIYNKIPIKFELNDMTNSTQIKKDFYKILHSIKIKTTYLGNNKELKRILQ